MICKVSYRLEVQEQHEAEQIERCSGRLSDVCDNSSESCKERLNMRDLLGWAQAAQGAQANHYHRRGKEAVETRKQKHHTETA